MAKRPRSTITITKRPGKGTTIRATGSAAQALFEAMCGPVGKPSVPAAQPGCPECGCPLNTRCTEGGGHCCKVEPHLCEHCKGGDQ